MRIDEVALREFLHTSYPRLVAAVALVCGSRVLIQTSATQVPPDSPDSRWHATETWFDLQPDGTVTIVDRGNFEEAIGSGPPSFAQQNDLCGAPLPRPFGGG